MPDLVGLEYFHFLRPLWLLALLGLAPIAMAWRRRRERSQWSGIIAAHLLGPLTVGGAQRRRWSPATLAMLMAILAIVAMAGPSWERTSSPFAKDEAALVIALDTSPSMSTEDVQPSRLDRARHKISDLLAIRGGARTALLVFAGSAHSVIPLTDDADIIRNFLDAIDLDIVPRAGKRPQQIIPLADAMLEETGMPGSILLITDGVSDVAIQAFADYFATVPHQLLVLGVGDPARESRQPLDETGLEALAERAGGIYQRLTLDDSDVRRIQRRVDNHLVVSEDSSRPWVDAGYYLCFPLALMFVIWFRRGWTVRWCLVLLFAGAAAGAPRQAFADWQFADLWASRDQQGMYYFDRGDYAQAAQRFRDPAWKATAFYLNEEFDIAAELFASLDEDTAAFAHANALAHARHYVRARQAYRELLQRNPAHEGAQLNLARVQAIIDEINLLSESQQAEPGDASRELGDEPQTADGAERNDLFTVEEQQLSAEDILNDPRLNELWMKQIQQDPRRFLSVKFQMQLRSQQAGGD